MDALDLPVADYALALGGLQRINRISRTAKAIASPIIQFLQRTNSSTNVTLLDVAAGGADVSLDTARLLREQGSNVELTLCDRNDTILKLAREHAARVGQNVSTAICDATTALPEGQFDVVISTLFLHHLTFDDAVRVLQNMRRACRGILVVSDLRRSRGCLLMAHVACRVLSRSRLVHVDGPQSVRAAWTMPELARIAAAAGLTGARVTSSWPGRQLLVWEANPQ